MPDEKKTQAKTTHTVLIEDRGVTYITGVTDVVSFDEDIIIADTHRGVIVVKGSGLHVSKLNLDNEELNIAGEVNAFTYENRSPESIKGKSSVFGKIFK